MIDRQREKTRRDTEIERQTIKRRKNGETKRQKHIWTGRERERERDIRAAEGMERQTDSEREGH
jgi:hypothetical protein